MTNRQWLSSLSNNELAALIVGRNGIGALVCDSRTSAYCKCAMSCEACIAVWMNEQHQEGSNHG